MKMTNNAQVSRKATDKQRILNEIKRTAEANGGVPLGTARFLQETGIKVTDWEKLWPRWGDAVREAGFEPNKLNAAYDTEMLVEKFVSFTRELGKLPVRRELQLKARNDKSFPSANVFARLGSKGQLAARILDYCKDKAGYEDVIAFCTPVAVRHAEHQDTEDRVGELEMEPTASPKEGFVYMGLLKLGRERRYKIGKAVLVERRKDQISLQLPGDLEQVHVIKTDDAYGIEDYWHRRFAAKNTKGEWFSLSRQDVEAFKRRKFM
jgi:hypothetical protein